MSWNTFKRNHYWFLDLLSKGASKETKMALPKTVMRKIIKGTDNKYFISTGLYTKATISPRTIAVTQKYLTFLKLSAFVFILCLFFCSFLIKEKTSLTYSGFNLWSFSMYSMGGSLLVSTWAVTVSSFELWLYFICLVSFFWMSDNYLSFLTALACLSERLRGCGAFTTLTPFFSKTSSKNLLNRLLKATLTFSNLLFSNNFSLKASFSLVEKILRKGTFANSLSKEVISFLKKLDKILINLMSASYKIIIVLKNLNVKFINAYTYNSSNPCIEYCRYFSPLTLPLTLSLILPLFSLTKSNITKKSPVKFN